MRALLKLFPACWRERYGDDFLAQLSADPRRVAKWVDAVRTASGLRWRTFRASDDGLAVGLVGALALALACDLALGIGIDERVDGTLLRHWWGAPFAAVIAVGAAIATASLAAILADRRRRRAAAVLSGAVFAAAAAGSALLAAVSLHLAGLGAGVGVVLAASTARALMRTPLGRVDALLFVAVPMILMLGWRSASGPVGPLALLVVAGALLSTRTRPRELAA